MQFNCHGCEDTLWQHKNVQFSLFFILCSWKTPFIPLFAQKNPDIYRWFFKEVHGIGRKATSKQTKARKFLIKIRFLQKSTLVRNNLACEKHVSCLLWCPHWKTPKMKLFGQGCWRHLWHTKAQFVVDTLLELSHAFCFPFWVCRIREQEPDMWSHRRSKCKESHLSNHTQKV